MIGYHAHAWSGRFDHAPLELKCPTAYRFEGGGGDRSAPAPSRCSTRKCAERESRANRSRSPNSPSRGEWAFSLSTLDLKLPAC